MRKERIIVLALMTAIASTSLTACSLKSESPIVGKIMGLKGSEIFKVDKLTCTSPEYMLVLMNTLNQYENDLGQTVDWNVKVDSDTTLQDFIMAKVKEDISLKYALSAMAGEHNVALTEDEKSKISEAAKQYYSKLTKEEKEYTKAEAADVEKVYTNYCLADKVYSKLTENVGTKISDEEARVIKIQYIRMNTSKNKANKIRSTLQNVVDLVNGGYQEFSKEAKQYSEDSVIEKVIKKNEVSVKYEIEAFNLKNKEISNILQDGDDYYLIYCKEGYMKKETESNKKKMISQTKKDYFDTQYKHFLDSVKTEYNETASKKIKLPNDENISNSELITIYNTIKK